jgi:hypothetical protein
MKLFSKLVESNKFDSLYKIRADIELNLKAKNQGEASYLADSILAAVKNQSGYTINSVEKMSEMKIQESLDLDLDNLPNDLTPEDKIKTAWNNTFADKTPNKTEKMEFYHQLRNAGFDGMVIFNALKGKI